MNDNNEISTLDALIENWIKANPSLGNVFSREDIIAKVKAQFMSEKKTPVVSVNKKVSQSKSVKTVVKKASKKQVIKTPVKSKVTAKKTVKPKVIKKKAVKVAKIAKPVLWRLAQMDVYNDWVISSISTSESQGLMVNARRIKHLISEMKSRLNRSLAADNKKAKISNIESSKLDTNVSK